jgi:hypothetical protein
MPKKAKFFFADVREALAARLAGSAEQREFLWAHGWPAWHKKFNLDIEGERTDGGVFPASVPLRGQWTTAPLGEGECLWKGVAHFVGKDPEDPLPGVDPSPVAQGRETVLWKAQASSPASKASFEAWRRGAGSSGHSPKRVRSLATLRSAPTSPPTDGPRQCLFWLMSLGDDFSSPDEAPEEGGGWSEAAIAAAAVSAASDHKSLAAIADRALRAQRAGQASTVDNQLPNPHMFEQEYRATVLRQDAQAAHTAALARVARVALGPPAIEAGGAPASKAPLKAVVTSATLTEKIAVAAGQLARAAALCKELARQARALDKQHGVGPDGDTSHAATTHKINEPGTDTDNTRPLTKPGKCCPHTVTSGKRLFSAGF